MVDWVLGLEGGCWLLWLGMTKWEWKDKGGDI